MGNRAVIGGINMGSGSNRGGGFGIGAAGIKEDKIKQNQKAL